MDLSERIQLQLGRLIVENHSLQVNIEKIMEELKAVTAEAETMRSQLEKLNGKEELETLKEQRPQVAGTDSKKVQRVG